MSNSHPHAENMLLYAQDAAETDRPWERWEVYLKLADEWLPLEWNPSWLPEEQFRRKPRVVNLNGFEYPEPERKAPAIGSVYWTPRANGEAVTYAWVDDETDRRLLRHGKIHLTEEGAKAHALAIIKAGRGEL